jgi:hypothetical protein
LTVRWLCLIGVVTVHLQMERAVVFQETVGSGTLQVNLRSTN